MTADGSIIIDTKIDTSGFNVLSSSVSGLPKILRRIGSAIGAAFAVGKLTAFAKEAIQLGSDLSEVQNVVDITFTTLNEKIDEFAENAVFVSGLSETMAKKYTGTFGAMAKSFDFTEKEAFELSTTLTTLSGDIASFYNITQDEAFTKLKSVFTGETESLKDLGVVMTQTALDAYAMEQGIGKTVAQMTEQEKVALRYSFVLDQLSAASGDFARTSGSWANQTRILSVQFDQLKATIGQGLINALTPVIVVINTILAGLQRIAEAFSRFTGLLFGSQDSGSAGATAAQMQNVADSYNDAAAGADSFADSTKKAAKEAKKSLMPFDELNKLTSDTADQVAKAGSAGSGGLGGIGNLGTITADADVKDEISPKIAAIVDNLKTVFAPVVDGFKDIWNWIQPIFAFVKDVGADVLGLLAYAWEKVAEVFTENAPEIRGILSGIGELIAMVWATIEPVLSFAREFISGFFRDVVDVISIAMGSIIKVLYGIIEFIVGVFAMDWERAWNGIVEIFTGIWEGLSDLAQFIWDGIVDIFWSIVDSIGDAVREIGGFFSNLFGGSATTYSVTPSVAAYSITPEVPALAKGAVLPANQPFLAMVGDQKHGTNVEAPLDTIKQAVAEVLAGQGSGEMTALLRELIAVVESIEVGDEVIGKAAARYTRKTARARGT